MPKEKSEKDKKSSKSKDKKNTSEKDAKSSKSKDKDAKRSSKSKDRDAKSSTSKDKAKTSSKSKDKDKKSSKSGKSTPSKDKTSAKGKSTKSATSKDRGKSKKKDVSNDVSNGDIASQLDAEILSKANTVDPNTQVNFAMGTADGFNTVGASESPFGRFQNPYVTVAKICMLHSKPLVFFCDTCEELLCADCTTMGPHNT